MAWLQGLDQAPLLVRRCVESWRRHNPGWDVRVLSEADMSRHTSFDHTVGPVAGQAVSHRTDLLRTDLLATHGGVWADATCYCTRPLDDWLPAAVDPSGFFAFARPGFDRPISSWFLAARPGNLAVTRLRDFLRDHMARPLRPAPRPLVGLLMLTPFTRGLWFSRLIRDRLGVEPYYAIHYAFELLLRTDPAFARVWQETPTVSARPLHALLWGGLTRPLTGELEREIEGATVPMHKLTFKFDESDVPPGSVLERLLRDGP
ncbi:MAG TPA: capsular polysaccharide synthesis protein [Gaiellaceae bacterium]|nr:capsular polysaccharide synthesis protein [Gaiellaceae bacterium]